MIFFLGRVPIDIFTSLAQCFTNLGGTTHPKAHYMDYMTTIHHSECVHHPYSVHSQLGLWLFTARSGEQWRALAWCQEHDTGTPQFRPNPLPERMCELMRCTWCKSGALANPTRLYTALQPPILAPNPAVARARARSHRSRCSRRPVRKMMSM